MSLKDIITKIEKAKEKNAKLRTEILEFRNKIDEIKVKLNDATAQADIRAYTDLYNQKKALEQKIEVAESFIKNNPECVSLKDAHEVWNEELRKMSKAFDKDIADYKKKKMELCKMYFELEDKRISCNNKLEDIKNFVSYSDRQNFNSVVHGWIEPIEDSIDIKDYFHDELAELGAKSF